MIFMSLEMYPAILFLNFLDTSSPISLRNCLFCSNSVVKLLGYFSTSPMEMRFTNSVLTLPVGTTLLRSLFSLSPMLIWR